MGCKEYIVFYTNHNVSRIVHPIHSGLPDGFEHMRKYEVPDVNHRLALSFSLDKFRGYLEAAGAEGSVRDQHVEESA